MKIRNFNDIYQKLLSEKSPILDTLHTRVLISAGSIFAILIIFCIAMSMDMVNGTVMGCFAIAEIFAVVIYILTSTKYRSIYKQTVIANMVRAYDPELNFEHKYGVTEAQYNKAGFREYHDRFRSEDLIFGRIDDEYDIRMSEVKTEREERTTDSEGHTQTTYVTVFQGIYGYIDVKDKFLPYFEVCSNKFFGKYDKARIEVDSAEFEKYYDLYAEDKIRTMEVFTSDLIEKFNIFKDKLNTPIQIKVKNGTLFFRLKMNNSFEAPTFGKALDFKAMSHNFDLMNEPLSLFSKIFENAKDTLD